MSLFSKLRKFFIPSPASESFASPAFLGKAERFDERFREVVSDPVNLLIVRVPEAGYVDGEGKVILHNGNRVPLRGPGSYYGDFSELLVINRGVHEPLEEYCFQQTLAGLSSPRPVMLELGSYWAHYSMWLKKSRPESVCHLVEADAANLEAGRQNFLANGFVGEFHQALVGRGGLQVDAFLRDNGVDRLDILHADIQGFEVEMLEGAASALAAHLIDRLFISTHSDALHASVEAALRAHGYQVEISSACARHTTSFDGFILASAPRSASGDGRLDAAWSCGNRPCLPGSAHRVHRLARMRLHKRLASAFRDWLRPDRAERNLAKKALESRFVERAAFGECLGDAERIELLTALLREVPAHRRQPFLGQVGFSRSQLLQDLFVLSELGERRDAGFFVEFGAADGVALSNSWLLEKRLGWKGILAEPARCWHAALSKNRACAIDKECVWAKSGVMLDFDEVDVGEFSTLSDFAQSDGHAQARSAKRRYQVPTVSLNDLLCRHRAPADPDYLSIDTEGSEFAILKELDFARFPFKIITCEHNHTPMREQVRQLLGAAGYRRKHEGLSRFDDWYVLSE